MCKSLKEGGLRCYSHTSAALLAAETAVQDYIVSSAVNKGLMTSEKSREIWEDAHRYAERMINNSIDYQELNHDRSVAQVEYVMGKERIGDAATTHSVAKTKAAIINLSPEIASLKADYETAKAFNNAEELEDTIIKLREFDNQAAFDAKRIVDARITQLNSGDRNSIINSQTATAHFNEMVEDLEPLAAIKSKYVEKLEQSEKLAGSIRAKAYLRRSKHMYAREAGYREMVSQLESNPTPEFETLAAKSAVAKMQRNLTNKHLKDLRHQVQDLAISGDTNDAFKVAKASLAYRIKQQQMMAVNIAATKGDANVAAAHITTSRHYAKVIGEMQKLYDMGYGGPDAALGLYYIEWDNKK